MDPPNFEVYTLKSRIHKFSKIKPKVFKPSIVLKASGPIFRAATGIEGSMKIFLAPDLIDDFDLIFGVHPL